MINTNEGIMDFFNKSKNQTAEEFFEIDKTGSEGAKGLILKMLDVMTPDVNIEYKGSGKEQADAVGYVQNYIKTSFLGKIDSNPNRSDNENADFAKFMDSEAWGENINFDTLIEATKELYEHAGNFFDETQTGVDAESQQQTILTLGVNKIPALLLFYCLKYLGSSLFKMKKRYNNKRGQPMDEQKSKKINFVIEQTYADLFKPLKKYIPKSTQQPTTSVGTPSGKSYADLMKSMTSKYIPKAAVGRQPGDVYEIEDDRYIYTYYVVDQGDYMGKIAKNFSTTLKRLKKLNPKIRNLNAIRVGQSILVGIEEKIECDLKKLGMSYDGAKNRLRGMIIKSVIARTMDTSEGVFNLSKPPAELEQRLNSYRGEMLRILEHCPELQYEFGKLPRDQIEIANGKFVPGSKDEEGPEDFFAFTGPYRKIAKVLNWGLRVQASSYLKNIQFTRSDARPVTQKDVRASRGKLKIGDTKPAMEDSVWGRDHINLSIIEFLAVYCKGSGGQLDYQKFNKFRDELFIDHGYGNGLYLAIAVIEYINIARLVGASTRIFYRNNPRALAKLSGLGLNYGTKGKRRRRMKESQKLDEFIYRDADFDKDAKKRKDPRYQFRARSNIASWFRDSFKTDPTARKLFRTVRFGTPSRKQLKVVILPRQGIPRGDIARFVFRSELFQKVKNGFQKEERLGSTKSAAYIRSYSHFVYEDDVEVRRDGKIIIDLEWDSRVANYEQGAMGRISALRNAKQANLQRAAAMETAPKTREEKIAANADLYARIRPNDSDDQILKMSKKAGWNDEDASKILRLYRANLARKQKGMNESVNPILSKYITENKQFLKEELFSEQVPADQLTQVIDIEDLPPEQRFRAYTILRRNNHDFTDSETNDYLAMLDDRSDDLTDEETNFILRNTEMPSEPDTEETTEG